MVGASFKATWCSPPCPGLPSFPRHEQNETENPKGQGPGGAHVARRAEPNHPKKGGGGGGGAGGPPPTPPPAHDYRLTNNTTTFTVDATAPGVAVLTEAYVPGDFRVTLNGAPADYFRVNHAFRGVRIPAAGKYVVSYSYWPRHFTLSLVMAAIGSLILIAWLIATFRRPRAAADLAGAELHA